MHLSCDRQELSDALALTSLVAPARSTRAMLTSLCFSVESAGLEILATDLEVGLRVRCQRVDSDSEGRFLLNASHTASILRELGEDRVEIQLDGDVATISAAGNTFNLVADPADEFPSVPSFQSDGAFPIEAELLHVMLRKTSFAAASEALRYALNGVLFETGADVLRLIATDGKRLALCERAVTLPPNLEVSRVVSNKAVALLSRLTALDGGQLELRFEENQLLARSSRASLAAQLVQGHFPPYRDVLPKALSYRVEFETQQFAAAIRRAALMTSKDSFAVRFAFGHNLLTFTSRAPGVGDGKVELPIVYEHDPLSIALNPVYVTDVLKVLDEPRFALEMSSETEPFLVREGPGFLYLIMPLDLA